MLADLDPEQLAAAQYGDGPLLIVAGAGTGKTATLVHRVAHLIAGGADPRRILLLTFTRRAAAEMLRRVDALLAETAAANGRRTGRRLRRHRRRRPCRSRPRRVHERVWGGTFHAIAARLLRVHARDIGLQPDFTILDRGDSEDLMHVARTALGVGRTGTRFPRSPPASTCTRAASTRSCRCRRCCARRSRGASRRRRGPHSSSRATRTAKRSSGSWTTTTCSSLARPARRPRRRAARARALRVCGRV